MEKAFDIFDEVGYENRAESAVETMREALALVTKTIGTIEKCFIDVAGTKRLSSSSPTTRTIITVPELEFPLWENWQLATLTPTLPLTPFQKLKFIFYRSKIRKLDTTLDRLHVQLLLLTQTMQLKIAIRSDTNTQTLLQRFDEMLTPRWEELGRSERMAHHYRLEPSRGAKIFVCCICGLCIFPAWAGEGIRKGYSHGKAGCRGMWAEWKRKKGMFEKEFEGFKGDVGDLWSDVKWDFRKREVRSLNGDMAILRAKKVTREDMVWCVEELSREGKEAIGEIGEDEKVHGKAVDRENGREVQEEWVGEQDLEAETLGEKDETVQEG